MVDGTDRPAIAGADRAPVATFFCGETLLAGTAVTLSGDAAHHMRVARIPVGEYVALRNGAGMTAKGTLVKISRTSALVDVLETREVPRAAQIHLLAPVADRDRMLWLAEKVTELGITSWRPVSWRRSKSVSPRGEGPTFQAKVRARMTSALIQSGGAWLPDMFPEASVERAVSAAPPGTRILLSREGRPIAGIPMREPVTIALGPEGGIEAAEESSFTGSGFLRARVGVSTLRFETAGVAAVGIAVAQLSNSVSTDGQA
ncbi:MAG: RsmE family RNA methyltransferase [Gemmatimonadota bacterium]|nr:RsmE family RNA methyltransferase [Gemmatimonadota bacterium]